MLKNQLLKLSHVLGMCILMCSIQSCRKDEPITKHQAPESFIEESKNYFEANIANTDNGKGASILKKGKNLRQFASKKPLWNEAHIKKISIGDAVVIPLSYNNATIYTKAGSKKQALSLNNLSYLMIYKNKLNKLTAELVTWLPDDEWWDNRKNKDRPFTGKVIVENWRGDFIKGYQYGNDGKIEPIKSIELKSNSNKTSVESLVCTETDWYVCFSAGGYTECRYEYTETSCTVSGGGGGGFGDGYWGGNTGGGSSGGGGGTNPSDYPPAAGEGNNCPPLTHSKGSTVSKAPVDCDDDIPVEPIQPVELSPSELEDAIIIIDDQPAIEDITKYMDCFKNGTGQSYRITIYVDQPVHGQNDQFLVLPIATTHPTGLGIMVHGVIRDVGHSFAGFEKINTDGSVARQILGFYPKESGVRPKGTIKDDSGHPFDVSYTVTLNESQFNLALQGMKNDFEHAYYGLSNINSNQYNCVDAAKSWLGSTGTNLPDAPRGFFKNTPGDFGQALRNQTGADVNKGVAPVSDGPCN